MNKINPLNNKITKLYIANRGEIALRIQRTARRLGMRCCFGISEADKTLSFSREADEVVIVGPAQAQLSYLNIDAVIEAALRSGSDALHPGYGFLSENPVFASCVIEAGLCWVGPSPESIRLMGSKIEGRARAKELKVPTVPGTPGGLSDQELIDNAKKIGCPLIVKAVAGGGGRGMRVIRSIDQLSELLPRARSEALKNFGNQDIFLERFLETPRHVEVQLLGDQFGSLIHLGTRDCSVQRRHQKLIEEAPAPFLTEKQRDSIQRAALAVARSVGYYSTGTAEFLVDGKDFYFLEMNTRIQVEHPVTEAITGLDLVEQQLRVAQGETLGITQREVSFSGHAIEFRINAEDSAAEFSPTTGELSRIHVPEFKEGFLRADLGFASGDVISLFYDGLIGKLIVTGKTRHETLQNSVKVLNLFVCEGITTNQDFHRWIVRTRLFNENGVDIAFVGREFSGRCLEDLAAADLCDPGMVLIEGLPAGYGHKETLAACQGEVAGKQAKEIEIIQTPEGIFIASIIDGNLRGKKKIRVASNSRQAAVTEVLGEWSSS